MAALVVGYDATRLFLGPLSLTPRGIDRIELEYARHFFRHAAADCFAVLPTPWGIRCYSRERALRGLDRLEQLWPECLDLQQDQAWLKLKGHLEGVPQGRAPQGPRDGLTMRAQRMVSLLKATGIGLGSDVSSTLPEQAIYLNIGQISLAIPLLLRWLQRRIDIRPVFMLHDAIPLETPEYVEPAGVRGHARMIEQAARYAAGLVVTTQAAKASVCAALAERDAPTLPMLALPFPVPSAFSDVNTDHPPLTSKPYFLVCGAIEPRKNHLLLLEVWKRLYARMGAATPLLLIVGASGWHAQFIEDRIRRTPIADTHIHIVKGLSTAALKHIMAGATGLLMPSFIEGFGLPIVEAASLGTPVVASDIDAHREVAPKTACLVDPIDGQGWEQAILSVLERHRGKRDGISLCGPADSRNLDWQSYFEQLTTFMTGLERRQIPGTFT